MDVTSTRHVSHDSKSELWRMAYWAAVFVLAVFVAIDTYNAYTEFAIGDRYRSLERVLESGNEELIDSTFSINQLELKEKTYLAFSDSLIMQRIDGEGWPEGTSAGDRFILSSMSFFTILIVGIMISKPVLKKLRAL